MGKFPCVGCKTLTGFTNHEDLCINCSPLRADCAIIENDITEAEQNRWALEVEKLNRVQLTLYKGWLQPVAQSFSLALDYCHQAEVNAKTDRDIWMAKIQMAKLKAVWVVDIRGGKKNGRTWIEKLKRRCNVVLVGKIDKVWNQACEIETKRSAIRSRYKQRRNGVEVRNISENKPQGMKNDVQDESNQIKRQINR